MYYLPRVLVCIIVSPETIFSGHHRRYTRYNAALIVYLRFEYNVRTYVIKDQKFLGDEKDLLRSQWGTGDITEGRIWRS